MFSRSRLLIKVICDGHQIIESAHASTYSWNLTMMLHIARLFSNKHNSHAKVPQITIHNSLNRKIEKVYDDDDNDDDDDDDDKQPQFKHSYGVYSYDDA